MEISVVLPVHNCGKFLLPALQSIKYQSYPHFEVLLVNDRSDDGSEEVCAKIANVDDRFRLLESPHPGMAAALNFGILQARGTYIARMDGDDLCLPERFSKQVQFLKDNPDISFLGTFAQHIDQHSKVTGSFEFPEDDFEIKSQLDRGMNTFVHPSMMIRRRALVDLRGYREIFSICQDYDLWLRAQDRYSFANLPEHLIAYRGYPDKRDLNDRFWKHFYIAKLADTSMQQRRAGRHDPVDQMADECDLESVHDTLVRERLMAARQDYYCNKKAFVDHKPLNSMDIDQIHSFLLTNKETFNKKALGHAFGLLFDQAIRIEDTESAETLYKLQQEISKSRHLKSLLAKPSNIIKYALRRRPEPV
ncbi:putative glycosyltransferase EpsE [Pseudovibrio axinellae]|uniref:Putative glycosyltransferase EpsE n=1 Tax=Pseudovibrio axinellae TaxID=989403 RepID=A0A165SY26_9HYPH|nr:putative glycosyltransferase EpsE [Pseudovibrio axinellae]SER64637.1 Glycosyl transferase family 2 [Pseudovibrio axinellae]